MNLLLLAAFWGVLMMFVSLSGRSRSFIRVLALVGMGLMFISTVAEMQGFILYDLNAPELFSVDRYALVILSILSGCGFLYFMLSAQDMADVGSDYSEYFALIFFIFCGFVLVLSFNSLLMLFLGIEIMTIPLYILTGSDKRNLKSNEASLKYFLLGAFSTGLMLMGIALLYGARGTFSTAEVAGAVLPIQWLMGGMFLVYAFDYLPHYPFTSTERYENTRIQAGRLRHFLLLGQNYHLIHHLWVSVPWFSYREVFNDLEIQLRAHGARIE